MFSLSSTLDALTHSAGAHPVWMAGVVVTTMWLGLLRAGPRPMR
jgi:hypothetical protein